MKGEKNETERSEESKVLHLQTIGKHPRSEVADIARTSLESRTSLDRAAIGATIDALQAVLPDLVNVVIDGFTRTPKGPLEAQTCPGVHSCAGEFEPGSNSFSSSKCAIETCSIQACGNHTCGANACSTESCVNQSCTSHAPPQDDDVFKSHTFAAIKEHLERLSANTDNVQPITLSLNIDTNKLTRG